MAQNGLINEKNDRKPFVSIVEIKLRSYFHPLLWMCVCVCWDGNVEDNDDEYTQLRRNSKTVEEINVYLKDYDYDPGFAL